MNCVFSGSTCMKLKHQKLLTYINVLAFKHPLNSPQFVVIMFVTLFRAKIASKNYIFYS
jgi:hypothetical protein